MQKFKIVVLLISLSSSLAFAELGQNPSFKQLCDTLGASTKQFGDWYNAYAYKYDMDDFMERCLPGISNVIEQKYANKTSQDNLILNATGTYHNKTIHLDYTLIIPAFNSTDYEISFAEYQQDLKQTQQNILYDSLNRTCNKRSFTMGNPLFTNHGLNYLFTFRFSNGDVMTSVAINHSVCNNFLTNYK